MARRWWSTILIATWVGGLAGYLIASGIPPTYEGQARLLVGPVVGDTNVLRGAASVSHTYAELVTSQPVIDQARERLDLPAEVPWVVRATADETTRILIIRAEHGDPEVAAAMANALAEALIALGPADVAIPEGELAVIEPAAAPDLPIAPQVTLITIIAAGTGLLASSVLVLLVEYFSNTVSTTRELADITGLPVLGSAALGYRFRPTRGAPIIAEAQPESRGAAAARLIATKIAYADAARPIQTVLALGTARRDGSADLAANVASVMARSGRRAILLDANEDNGEVSQIFGLEGRLGLSDLLHAGEAGIEQAVVHQAPGLDIIPAGLADSVDLLDPEIARQLIERLRARYELIVLNASPIDRSGSTLVWARIAEGTVVVAERDRTKRDDVAYAMEHLAGVGARVLGAVMVDHPPRLRQRRQGSRGQGRSRPDRQAARPSATDLGQRDEPYRERTTARPERRRDATGLRRHDEARLE